MKITATICNPSNESDIIQKDISLADFATQGNLLDVNNKLYIVCHSLFKKRIHPLSHEYEQIIKPFTFDEPKQIPSHLLLLGKIYFENENEADGYFKSIAIKGFEINDKIIAPYTYMRRYDCIQVDQTIYICDHILVKEDIEIRVEVFRSPLTLKKFRDDKNRFCRNVPSLSS